jgi:pimeloyl-ACP methyl ester carboxylesterase
MHAMYHIREKCDFCSRLTVALAVTFVFVSIIIVLFCSSLIIVRQRQIHESQFQQHEFITSSLSMRIGSTGIGQKPYFSNNKNSTIMNKMNLDRSKRGYTDPTLVLLHDAITGWNSYSDLIPLLSHDFSLLYPDLRGHNYSFSTSTKVPLMTTLRDDIVNLLKFKVPNQPVVLIGHGLSGIILYSMACDQPQLFNKDHIRGIVTINAPHFEAYKTILRSNAAQQEKSSYLRTLFTLRDQNLLSSLVQNDFRDLFALLSMNGSWIHGREQYYIDSWKRQSPMNALDWIFSNYQYSQNTTNTTMWFQSFDSTFSSSSRNCTITDVPVLSIWGTENQFYDHKALIETIKYVPDMLIKEITGTHWVMHEEPGIVAQAIREFIYILLKL